MSIYGSGLVDFDSDDHADGCAVWVKCSPEEARRSGRPYSISGTGQFWLHDDTKDCSCGCGPIRYQGSHVLPSDGGDRSGSLSLCTIAGFIGQSGRPALSEDTRPYWPWLRLTACEEASSATLLLDARQVRHVRDQLTFWLDNIGGGDRG